MSSILTVEGVNKNFSGLKALDDVNLVVEEGSVHAIIGPNGAGKSTFLNCLVGRLVPDTGTVLYYGNKPEGETLFGLPPHAINQKGISRVFQTPEVFEDLTLFENAMIPVMAHLDGSYRFNSWGGVLSRGEIADAAEHILSDVGLLEKRNMHSGSLSRGDKRRLELAMCLAQDPKLLLLDEPTAGMARADTNNTIDLLKKIGEERKITKVIIEHDMHVVFSLATKVSVLARGHIIAEGAPQEMKGDARVQEAYLGGAHL
ncbi:ABC transporter ATP-binding protein [Terasakiella brassicae]|uniref:ABC transporter ATP-binding protein n=1 Tax=Terasakiella brassicae TaxID=1634917 RepID=A0A917BW88_9PROT|nr:ABC transporter ATP-binding protein [Terasakiella brassicae]GGF57058.1 ABC transporter ATP-binding protein [Terasakiella brassicae]